MYAFPYYFVGFEYYCYNNIKNSFLLCILFARIIGMSQFLEKKYFKMSLYPPYMGKFNMGKQSRDIPDQE